MAQLEDDFVEPTFRQHERMPEGHTLVSEHRTIFDTNSSEREHRKHWHDAERMASPQSHSANSQDETQTMGSQELTIDHRTVFADQDHMTL